MFLLIAFLAAIVTWCGFHQDTPPNIFWFFLELFQSVVSLIKSYLPATNIKLILFGQAWFLKYGLQYTTDLEK